MLKTLPFDSDAMLAGLRSWIECESPTYDAAAVDRMMDLAAYDLASAGAEIERIPGRMGFGGSVRARFPHRDFGNPGILISGHLDTVHPIGTLKNRVVCAIELAAPCTRISGSIDVFFSLR